MSRQLFDIKANNISPEHVCLALVYASQSLRHYFLPHQLHLMVKANLVHYLLLRPRLTRKLAKWLLLLPKFDIMCETPSAIKGQADIDMIATFSTFSTN